MSRAEEITSEVRKLVLTCRSMQAQLEQSIPKKTHQELVAKMQASIDGTKADLERTNADLEKTVTIGERLNSLAQQVALQNDKIASQEKAMEALKAKLSESTVPSLIYSQSLARNQELEERIECMVDRSEHLVEQRKAEELELKVATMVPRAELEALQVQIATMVPSARYEEKSQTLASIQEQLMASESRASVLESRLANSVPRSDFEELTAKIAQLTMEAARFSMEAAVTSSTEIQTTPYDLEVVHNNLSSSAPAQAPIPAGTYTAAIAETQPKSQVPASSVASASAEPAQPIVEPMITATSAEAAAPPTPSSPAETTIPEAESVRVVEASESGIIEKAPIAAAAPAQEPISVPQEATGTVAEAVSQVGASAVEEVNHASDTSESSPAAPDEGSEIREVQSQLSEIKGAEDAGQTTLTTSVSAAVVDSDRGFRFSNSELCATSALDFLHDLEKVALETIEYHTKNGDFERWFQDVLADRLSAESLKSVREGNFAGEDLRVKTIEIIAPRYRQS